MTFYRNLAETAVSLGWSVQVIEGSAFSVFDTATQETINGVSVEGLESARLERWAARFHHLAASPSVQKMLAAAWAAREQSAQHGPFDLVEATEFGLLHVPYILESTSPVVVQCHAGWGQIGLYDPTGGKEFDQALALAIETEGLRHASARHTSADANASWWERQGAGPFAVIRPCWHPPSETLAGEMIDGVIRVFGRIQAWKGPDVVAKAWSAAPELPDINWHGRDVATDSRGGSTCAALKAAYSDVWGSRIRPQPTVPPVEVAQLQARALLNLVPSTWDVFNFTAVEAMSSGRPAVCSDKAGASELIEDGRTGFVYDGSSPTALIDAIRRALALSPEQLACIGKNGRDSVLDLLNPERQARAHLEAYEAALAAPKPAPDVLPAWFRTIALPRAPARVTSNYLDQYPLRDLVAYVIERSARKARIKL